jgi:hypothetical protein
VFLRSKSNAEHGISRLSDLDAISGAAMYNRTLDGIFAKLPLRAL